MLDIRELSNAVRFLSVDTVQSANSGHPGMPLGMADIATVLWREFLNHSPQNPVWINRDRFVLSNGHGSVLLYSLLHLSGYDISLNDLKKFRQLHSNTPGHPEFGLTPGVETTTGPLGQGIANAVGMAMAEKILAEQFNRPQFKVIDHYTYVFVGDGCLMEGISHEVASLAGTQGLGKLIVFWDNNGISIDGSTEAWFTENIVMRFHAYGWQVISSIDGHNHESIRQAIVQARENLMQPTIIDCKTVIGYGAPNLCNSHRCHGAPLGDKEIALMREKLGWSNQSFSLNDKIYAAWDAKIEGKIREKQWNGLFHAYEAIYPELAAELQRRVHGEFPLPWLANSKKYAKTIMENLATRQASQKILEVHGRLLPELLGGSADLTPSNLTNWSGSKAIVRNDATGNYIHYGVREFGMMAIMNGIALHGGFIPYGGTFLVFANYGLSAIRMAALMKLRVIYVFTHDSIGLGEDGSTHQPVEHLTMLRATPNLSVWRPADSTETALAWQYALMRKNGPTALILSRQELPLQKHDDNTLADIEKGGYILLDCEDKKPDLILMAAGSEVELSRKVALNLQNRGLKIRVVSIPSQDIFDNQNISYKNKVLPPEIRKRVAVEAAASMSWYKYVGIDGKIIALDCYGASAPGKILFEFFGFSVENIEKVIFEYLTL